MTLVPDGAEVIVLFEEGAETRNRSSGTDLINSAIFGMWKDRTDIQDSAA